MHGILISTVMIAGFAYAYAEHGVAYARAIVFYVTVFAQLFFSFACRSQRFTLPQLGLFTNPYLLGAIVLSGALQVLLLWLPFTRAVFFGTAPHFGFDWLLIFGLALAPVSIIEIAKIIRSRGKKGVNGENRSVQMGRRNDFETEVLTGLQENESLITHPSDKARDGTKIEPTKM
jgi:Ca2+-transporting ATPase